MSRLYWACDELRVAGLLDVATSLDRVAKVIGRGNGWPVIEIQDPDWRLLRETACLILQRQLISAAVVGDALSPDELFIAAEWGRRLVVARSELSIIGEIVSWVRHESDFQPRDLSIFQVVESAEPQELVPLAVNPVSAAAVLRDPIAYYGPLADPRVGGANALFAAGLEAARERGLSDDQVLVGEPEALGFSVDLGHSSIVAWRQKGVIAASAFGFSLQDWQEVVAKVEGFRPDHLDHDGLAAQVEQWVQQDFRFGLAVLLRGLKDPPVVIPMGSVYQQPAMGSRSQNLAVAQPHQVTVGVGASLPLVLPAWCLNPTFSPPHGPMTATPLVVLGAGGSQARSGVEFGGAIEASCERWRSNSGRCSNRVEHHERFGSGPGSARRLWTAND